MNRQNKILLLAISLLTCLIFLRYIDPIPIQIVRASLFDFYQRLEPRQSERLPVTIIDIDEKSLAEIGQWPWPRTMLADLLQKLSEVQPLVIGFDMVFPEPDRLSPANIISMIAEQSSSELLKELNVIDNDQLFAAEIARQPVVLGTMLNNFQAHNNQAYDKTAISWNIDPSAFLPVRIARLSSLEQLESAAKGVGVFTLVPEVDGVVRQVPTLFKVNNEILPSFGMELLRVALGADIINVTVDDAGVDAVEIQGIVIPTDLAGLTRIHFNEHQPVRFVSAVDVLEGSIDQEALLGHIFLIGASAIGLYDIKMTPMAEQMPGVEIWAQWLESSLFANLLERPNYAIAAEIFFLLAFGLLLIFLTFKASAMLSLLVYTSLSILSIGLSWWMYINKSLLLDFSFPALSTGVLFAFLILMKFWREERQRKQIKNAFSHYLAPSIVDELATNPGQLKLGGEVREITSLFTDLQGFTELTEKIEPEKLVDIVNQYLDGICQIAIEHGGTIDKIIGDAVHVIFGAPKIQPDHADLATTCALKIDAFCKQFSKQKISDYKLGVTRIGINSGAAVVGNFGGQQRFDYTAYGDTINTAARLESANHHLGTLICVSESTKELCTSHSFRPVADLIVKGKSQAITVYEPIQADSNYRLYLEQYSVAYSNLKKQNPESIILFKKLLDQHPDDNVISTWLNHLDLTNEVSSLRELSQK